jgi:MFS family permease
MPVAVADDPVTQRLAPVAVPDSGDRNQTPHRLVAAFAITQTVGYGVLYYAFAVVLLPVASDLRTSATAITGALTVSVLVSAVCAIPVGRWLDRHGEHALMTTGSILSTIAVAAWSQVQTVSQLYAVFAVLGVGSAMVL